LRVKGVVCLCNELVGLGDEVAVFTVQKVLINLGATRGVDVAHL